MAAKKAQAQSELDVLFAGREAISASELADFVQRDAKVVRGYLRMMKERDQSTLKNQRWLITKEIAERTATHYSAAKQRATN